MLNESDAHYTPAWLADRLAAELAPVFSAVRTPTIADFAAGDGSLLEAVERRWGARRLTATDVDRGVVQRLRRAHPRWRTGVCDLLSPASRQASRLIDDPGRLAHAVILNPPFSYRGAATFPAFGGTLRCSPALACLAASIEQVATRGTIVALMPASTFTAQKDEEVWRVIHRLAEVTLIEEFARGVFPGAHADVGLVAVAAIDRAAIADVADDTHRAPDVTPCEEFPRSTSATTSDAQIHRGCLPMHLADLTDPGPDSLALIHSTDLQAGTAIVRRWVTRGSRVLRGPAVLIPRVGQPRRDKVALLKPGDKAVLSDCVIGLACRTRAVSVEMHSTFVERWDDVVRAYHGSCAPYLTVRDLQEAVEKLGYSVEA